MKPNECVRCQNFPCLDVNHAGYCMTGIDLDPARVSVLLVSEAAASNPADNYYAGGTSLFEQTTVQAFQDAGANVTAIHDILDLGVYLTTAVKCSKTAYAIQPGTIETCSFLLEQELALFPNWKVMLLMGDVSIKAVNLIAKRNGEKRVIPAEATYKIRGREFFFRGKRVLPSYLQAGPSFYIEKVKRKMIAEDIRAALDLIK